MPNHKMRCEVIEIIDNRYSCQKLGNAWEFAGTTPANMCAKVFHQIYPTALAMRFSDDIPWEHWGHHDGFVDFICQEQCVRFRLSRVPKDTPQQDG